MKEKTENSKEKGERRKEKGEIEFHHFFSSLLLTSTKG